METTEVTNLPDIRKIDAQIVESLVLNGDISKLAPEQKVHYYNSLCASLGLNNLTQPFQIMKFQGKERLYAGKDCTEQLRRIYGVSVVEMTKERTDDLYIVTVKVQDKTGRFDIASGALSIKGMVGESLANQLLKCETKAKRRATLSIAGLGFLDETEVEGMTYETVPLHEEAKPELDIAPALSALIACKTLSELQTCWNGYEKDVKFHAEVVACKDQMKVALTPKEPAK